MKNYFELLSLTEDEVSRVDLVEMNLLVARSIPALAGLDIPRYQRLADEWAKAVRSRLPRAERAFHQTPSDWKNDIHFFRLGVLCGFLEDEVGIAYKEDQRNVTSILYTDPADLFLNGVMDTKRGTCASMAALHVAIGRRLGWPVSLACVRSHFICRYDDGLVTHNIEATQSGYGGFKSDPDPWLIHEKGLPPVALRCGSDLRALTMGEMLGAFVGLRARHMRDTGQYTVAELDCLMARRLYPSSRWLYIESMIPTLARGSMLFEAGEVGSPESLADLLDQKLGRTGWQPHPAERVYTTTVHVNNYGPMR